MINSNEITTYTKKMSILFVEDHEELRADTTDILKNFFKTIDSCSNGKEALEKYIEYKNENSTTYDIVLSDIQMPIMDGIELTKSIYEINPSQTIIILSAHDETKYLLSLINLGIEQFIKKPIDYQELLTTFLNASKKMVQKDIKDENNATIKLSNDFTYDINSKSLNDGTKNIYLTKFEIIFIELLTSSIGKIYSNEDIVLHYNSLEENIDSANIRKLVSKLRKKLPQDCLESIYGIGYKFIPYFNI
ncbi:response regulator transcription factor [Sulfurimonas sp.]